MPVKKKSSVKARVLSKSKKSTKKFQFKPWMALVMVLAIAVVGIVILRFSQASAGFSPGGNELHITNATYAGKNDFGFGTTKSYTYNGKTYSGYHSARDYQSGPNATTNKTYYVYFCQKGDELVSSDLVSPKESYRYICLTPIKYFGTGTLSSSQRATLDDAVSKAQNAAENAKRAASSVDTNSTFAQFNAANLVIKSSVSSVMQSANTLNNLPKSAPEVGAAKVSVANATSSVKKSAQKLVSTITSSAVQNTAEIVNGLLAVANVASSAAQSSETSPPPPPPTVGSVDAVRSDGGSCVVGGWAKDQSAPDKAVKVDLYVDKPAGQVGATYQIGGIVANDARSDEVGNHGYNILLPEKIRDGRQHTAYVYAHDADTGDPVLLSGSPKSFTCVPPNPIDGVVDGVANPDSCQVSGWAYDSSNKGASIAVAVNILDSNKKLLRQINGKADRDSKDVNDVEGITGKHRYVVQIPDEFRGGTGYFVSVHGIDSDGKGGNGVLKNSPRTFRCNDIKKGTAGSLSGVSQGQTCYFKGWAIDRDKPTAMVPVRLVLNGIDDDPKADRIIQATADKVTNDSAVVSGVAVGKHKFEIPVPSQYNTGQNYSFALYAASSTGRADLSTKFANGTFRCETPNVLQNILSSVGLATQNYQQTVTPEQNHLYWAVYDRSLSSANTSLSCNSWSWVQQLLGSAFCEVDTEKVLELKSPTMTAEFEGKVSMCIRAITDDDAPLTVTFVLPNGGTIDKTATYTSAPDTIIFGRKTVACVDNNKPFEIGSIDRVLISTSGSGKSKVYAARLKPVTD